MERGTDVDMGEIRWELAIGLEREREQVSLGTKFSILAV